MGGGKGGEQEAAAPGPAAAPAAYGQPEQYQQPGQLQGGVCNVEMKQFLDCAQTQHDITLCDGFNEALRQCRMSNGKYLLSVFSFCRCVCM